MVSDDLPALELCPDGGLNEVVCLQIHGSRRLVQYQNLHSGIPNIRVCTFGYL
jgi:hypothetical protein